MDTIENENCYCINSFDNNADEKKTTQLDPENDHDLDVVDLYFETLHGSEYKETFRMMLSAYSKELYDNPKYEGKAAREFNHAVNLISSIDNMMKTLDRKYSKKQCSELHTSRKV